MLTNTNDMKQKRAKSDSSSIIGRQGSIGIGGWTLFIKEILRTISATIQTHTLTHP